MEKNAFVRNYLDSVRNQFELYKSWGDKTLEQLKEEDLFWQFNKESNSIAIIVQHLWGNMLSRWTDFLSTDGEKEWRKRDEEFESIIKSETELLEKWEAGWACLFTAIDTLNEENFETIVYIRNQGHSITEALNRQLSHYSSHVGQIMYIGKMRKGKDWKSLSIVKGKSSEYNKEKFEQEKRREHFSTEFIGLKKK